MKKKQLNVFSLEIPIVRIMKIYLILFCCTLAKLFASNVNAQTITLTRENVKIKKILTEIEKSSDYNFFYNTNIVDVAQKTSLNIKNAVIGEALSMLFNSTDIDYSIVKKYIVLYPKNNLKIKEDIEALLRSNAIEVSNENKKLNLLLSNTIVSAAQNTINGKVTDGEGTPLPGVSIVLKGASTGTTTDFDGNFSINVPSASSVLRFTYIGFVPQEITVGNQSTINVTMEGTASELDEVVVVGYGTQKKVNLTGSIATIKSDDLVKNNTSNVSSALSGRLAGVVTIQSSGEPGADVASINIRGMSSLNSNAPLILVDGIPRGLNNINPNDIESISVLKDAAASAIYGMRAANGVVLITTKRGGTTKPQLSINSYSGIQTPTRLPDFLDSFNYGTLLNEANRNDGVAEAYSAEDLQRFQDGSSPDTHPNTDWLDESLKSNSMLQSHDISVRGSYEKLRYFTSLGYLFQNGLYANNKYDRFNFRTNIDVDISNSINLQADFSGSLEERERPSASASTLFSRLMRTPPTEVNQYSNGGYSIFSIQPTVKEGGYRRLQDFDFQSRIALNIDLPFVEGLNFTAQVAYDRSAGGNNAARDNFNGRIKNFTIPTSYTTFDPNTGEFSISNPSDRGETASLGESTAQGYQLTTEAILDYSRSFGKHDLGAKLVYSRTETEYNLLSAGRSNFLGNSIDFFVAGDESTRTNNNATFETAILGYAGRFTYAYDNKYLFEFNGRYDGSYKFSNEGKFGFFPSFSLAWRLSEENFLKNSSVINNLKIRGSYGELGSDDIAAFRYVEVFSFNEPFIDGGNVVKTLSSNGIPDATTTWEKAKTYNLGLEVGLWNNLFSLEADAFYKRTSDILANQSLEIPATFGGQLPQKNLGIVDNKGFEIILNHNNKINDIEYSANLNFGYARNKVIDIAEAETVSELLKRTGRPISIRTGFLADGLFLTQAEIDQLNANAVTQTGDAGAVYQTQNPQPGDIRYVDVNGDGVVNSDDRTVIGKGNVPEITFGLNLALNYKQFDLAVLFQGAANFDMYLSNEASWAFFNGGKVFQKHLERAQIGTDGNVINTNANYPRLTLSNNAVNERTSSYWVVPGDYIRFKNIEIGYTFPDKVVNKLGLDRLRIYLNGRNLATWSKIKHLDPENPQQRGWFYPQQKVFNIGFNVQL